MTESPKPWKQLCWHQKLVCMLLSTLLRVWGRTLRFRWGDDVQEVIDRKPPPAIVILWHNRLFAAPIFFLRYFRERRLSVLTSASEDGAWVAAFVGQLGIRSVRGSRHRRGAQAVRDLIDVQDEGCDIVLTPDGSRGPRYQMKAGAATIAMKTGAPILLLSFNHSGAWRLKTWDRFYIPHPFSQIEVKIDRVADVQALGDDAKAVASLLTERMNIITRD
ncbi:MAG: lysophospholipid acyltransferase family protein [Opitutales bacterium]